jgi:hypothetical protein
MATFTIRDVEKRKQFTTKHGSTLQSYGLTLEDGEKQLIPVELNQKLETAEPVIGATIEGTVEDGQYGKKFKKEQANSSGGFGGGKGRDPKMEAQIRHMHAQKCALSYAHLRQAQGKLPDKFELRDLFLIASRFREDVEAVG